MLRVTAILVSVLLLGGCQALQGLGQPTIAEESIGASEGSGLGTMAITPDRRLILTNIATGQFCAEPPAEAAEEITSAIAAALSAGDDDTTSSTALATSVSENVQFLYQRAHTLQLFRDAAFYLCVNAINQGENPTQAQTNYGEAVQNLVKTLQEPLREEIRFYYQAEIARAARVKERTDVIVCAPTAGDSAQPGLVQCQRMPPVDKSNPAVIAPPMTPEGAATRPVM